MPKFREAWKTYGNVFDAFTLRTLFKLSSEGHFDELGGPISIGKEANVFVASKGREKVVIKIYRIATCNFRKMFDYIKTDPRYLGLRRHKRRIIFAWTQREYRNLLKAREAGVSVPTPIAWRNHILVLGYIGDAEPALRLKDLPPQDPDDFCKRIVMNMKRLCLAGLVHGDLSPFNILNYHERPVFIDFSQCNSNDSPLADELWARDIKNIAQTCKRLGVAIEEDTIRAQLNRFKKEPRNR